MIYNSPGHSFQNLTSMLQNELVEHVDPQNPLVIMGDFDIDVSQKECSLEKFIAEKFHCYQLIHEPTTDQGSNTRFGIHKLHWQCGSCRDILV